MENVTPENRRLISKLFRVAASNIPGAGQGLFAKVNIPAGTYMGEYEGPLVTDEEEMGGEHTFGLLNSRGRQVEVRDGGTILKYLNHQGRWPLAQFDGYKLYAKRDIKAGDEVTFNYGMPLSQIISAHKPG